MNKKSIAATAIIGGVLIFCIKIYSWIVSGSVALLSDALESIVNILASIMMFVSILISGTPPDKQHRYGHQKIENISCFVEGLLIIGAGFMICYMAYGRLFNPVGLERLNFAVLISLLASVLNGFLSWILNSKAKETKSLALEGDAKHLLSDVISSIGVAAGLIIGDRLKLGIIDPVIALIVALLVLRMGFKLVLNASGDLMDESCEETEVEIKKIMNRHQTQFIDYHSLMTRKSGDRIFAELHLRLHGNESLQEAHDFTDHIESDVRDEFPQVTLTIHVEPEKSSEDED